MGNKLDIKKTFLDIISFGTPKAIFFNLFLVLFLLAVFPTEYLVYSPVKCVFKNVIFPIIYGGNCPTQGLFRNCECPACGLTRAMSRLLHFDISGAYEFNVLVFPVFALILVLMGINLVKILKN